MKVIFYADDCSSVEVDTKTSIFKTLLKSMTVCDLICSEHFFYQDNEMNYSISKVGHRFMLTFRKYNGFEWEITKRYEDITLKALIEKISVWN